MDNFYNTEKHKKIVLCQTNLDDIYFMNFDTFTFEKFVDCLPPSENFVVIQKDVTFETLQELFILLYWYERAFEVLENKAGTALIFRLKMFFFLNFQYFKAEIC